MKKIGLLGGTSWPSTIPYYEWFNRRANQLYGGYHSAKLAIHNVDYHRIKSQYTTHNGWDIIPDYLSEEISILAKSDPDCIVICNNTLHKAVDILISENNFPTDIPLIHIVEAVGEYAVKSGYKNLLLLGTKFTMEDGFYTNRLQNDYGLSVSIPEVDDRYAIQTLQTAISLGKMQNSFYGDFKSILDKYTNYDAVILGCTELPLAINEKSTLLPIIDVIEVQCEKAAEFAYGDE
jgi:aspartate racemase